MATEPRIAFVLGTGRCGSTLVHEVIARHPDVAFLSNLEDRLPLPAALGRWNNAVYRSLPASFTRKGRLRFAPSEGYRALDREVSPALSAPERDLVAEDATPWLAARTRAFVDRRAAAQGRPAFVHKLTGWPRAGFLDRVFPDARFVHVVRDGRAVANSFLQMTWWRGYEGPDAWGWGPLAPEDRAAWEASGRRFPLLAGLEWKLLIDAYDRAAGLLPADRWLEVRYEDFVAEPREVTGRLLAFLGLEWEPRFERGFARYTFSGDRTQAYRADLGDDDLALLEGALVAHLGSRGYVGNDQAEDTIRSPGTNVRQGEG
ncbi:MAG TPA: sulfotransferase [Actinomycetota bacterium]|nr:sulfotransferase [Actinomycetota bacterium]